MSLLLIQEPPGFLVVVSVRALDCNNFFTPLVETHNQIINLKGPWYKNKKITPNMKSEARSHPIVLKDTKVSNLIHTDFVVWLFSLES